jgi:hypothetical protein
VRSSEARLRTAAQREQAVGLRLAGGNLRAIASQIGISHEQVRRHIIASLDESRARTHEDVERLREQELRRLDSVILALWTSRADPSSAKSIIAASERRARLLGLDAPIKFDTVTTHDTGPAHLDVSTLTTEELLTYETLLQKMAGGAPPPASGVTVDVTPQPALPPKSNGATAHEEPG